MRWDLTAGLLAICLLVVAVDETEAQRRRGGSWGGRSLRPVMEFGIRAGRDYDIDVWSAGAQFRLPLGRRSRFQIIPSGDFFMAREEADWQANFDVAFRPGPRGGLYGGIGLAVTDRYRDGDGNRETKAGTNNFIGMRLPMRSMAARLYLEARWTYVDGESPFRLVVGLNWPLRARR